MIKRLSEAQKERIETLLDTVISHYEQEDVSSREAQIRRAKRLKYYWDGITHIWWDSIAHDWRVYDLDIQVNDSNQEYYDKPANVYRAYLESIIAALSVLVPPVTAYPDDADNPLDLQTAKAADKIGKLIYRHNDMPLTWLHALFILYTEGMVASYNYPKEDKSYGTYEVNETEDNIEEHEYTICSNCGTNLADISTSNTERDEFQPDNDDILSHSILNEGGQLCPECLQLTDPTIVKEQVIVERMVGVTHKPKARQCIETYGVLNVKIPNYAKLIEDCSYLFFDREIDFAKARSKYPKIREKIQPGMNTSNEYYARWGRLSTQYNGEEPNNLVTEGHKWLRPCSFEVLSDIKDVKYLKKYFPDGAKVTKINDFIADYNNESLDDCWTLSINPLTDYLNHDPLSIVLTALQDITNDLISLVLQTIEHGIPQTFVDPAVVNLKAYSQRETVPGAMTAATPKSGKSLQESFYEVKTASLSGEVLPFSNQVQELAQLVSGSSPTIFGGDLEGSKTASQYSMARTQSLQRLQTTWKILTYWWKNIFGKVIPAYIKTVLEQGDERYVVKDKNGNFVNEFIKRSEVQGKIGSVELEANENLPITWNQMRDILMNLLQANNPQLVNLIASSENIPLIYEAIGLTDLYIPGEDDRIKQLEEINQLLLGEPIPIEITEDMVLQAELNGQPLPPQEESSVPIEPEIDNNQIQYETVRNWAVSSAGLLAKTENPNGYRNVLLHGKAHLLIIQQQMMQMNQESQRTLASPNKKSSTPIKEDSDVQITA